MSKLKPVVVPIDGTDLIRVTLTTDHRQSERGAYVSMAHAARRHFGCGAMRVSGGASIAPVEMEWRAVYARRQP